MKVLRPTQPTSEQLTVINNHKPGVFVVRGAAGSGKTTTALYRLKFTVGFWQRRRRDGFIEGPVRVLVLTYNKTLRGYIEELTQEQIKGNDVELTISTFAKWATDRVPYERILREPERNGKLNDLAAPLPLSNDFVRSEVDYFLGRFMPDRLAEYVECERQGRGRSPRMPTSMRRRLLDEVIVPFQEWKKEQQAWDWADLANAMAAKRADDPYHVIVVDEAQDFSANQVRAVLNHVTDEHTLTFVLDAAQRIYPQRFTWAEVGLSVGSHNSKLLSKNFRNTRQIAAFAAPLLRDVETTDDAAIPDLSSCEGDGDKPLLVQGTFTQQMDHVVQFLNDLGPDNDESVAILHAKGGGWFSYVETRLTAAGLAWVELTRNGEWPTGPVNVALSTMHSAKGLEFDHVIIVGLNSEVMPHATEPGDSERDAHLRLLAMSAGRARKTLTITYKPTEASDLIACMDPDTYEVKTV
ncbi:3'-5' exonuclease [Streptomyces sp. NBC_00576]|uniref:3'-5' exonuclease n=1 Tax=Streptomyces sp. NBC_00576 TaxID=2903665 RepID=UPI002E80E435|nr:3'-5' exonuclease [Streptomyces sp. NBC_00576]WUB68656.1 AAA family ATPase [Streptomyces sp. NBC_00576]WUB77041.1 AAA family ATPase [Streptomyces sp. NBC_00576]